MTLIAGMLSRNDRPLTDAGCASLRQAISRHPADEVRAFRDRLSYFAKVDVEAFDEPGFYRDASGALSLLAGEPLLGTEDSSSSSKRIGGRLRDLTAIHEQCLKSNWNVLREAGGTFCVVHYQPRRGSLTLMADKLGIRPLYFWVDKDLIVFASTLRILEEFSLVPKKMDLRAVTEVVAFGAPLADRTPYAGISLLKAAEIMQVTSEGTSRSCYWRWDEIEVANDPEPARLAIVHDCFQAAVSRRNRNDQATVAYLSGGLDSRCTVAALRERGTRVRTFNFAKPGTQDYAFGNQFAAKIASEHASMPREEVGNTADFSSLMAIALGRSNHGQWPAERPRLVWSGEGGSVLLGHVHLSESQVASMRAGNIDQAIEDYMQREQIDLPVKLFRPQILEHVRDVIRQGVKEELDQLHADDAGRNLYLFLLHNDQRRKLMSHFENIDLHRLEFQLPFFDAGFLASVLATPLDRCLGHKFYVKWLSCFPPAVKTVPWQAYPGHEPCPLPVEDELGYQWDEKFQARERMAQRRTLLARASKLLSAPDFPHEILSKRNLRLAAWAHLTGWRDYEYAIGAAQTYYEYWKNCNGKLAWPSVI